MALRRRMAIDKSLEGINIWRRRTRKGSCPEEIVVMAKMSLREECFKNGIHFKAHENEA